MTEPFWSPLLAGFGLIGLYLAGRNSYWGWVLGLLDEVLWIAYAVSTRQWPFCLSALAYGWVYGRNLRAWLRAGQPPATPGDRGDSGDSGEHGDNAHPGLVVGARR